MTQIVEIDPFGERGIIRENGIPVHAIFPNSKENGYILGDVKNLHVPMFMQSLPDTMPHIFMEIADENPPDSYHLIFEFMQNLKNFHDCRAIILISFDPELSEGLRSEAAEEVLTILENEILAQYLPQMLQDKFLKEWIVSNSAVCKNEVLKTVLFSALETTAKSIEPIS